jgi:hypothetical protein
MEVVYPSEMVVTVTHSAQWHNLAHDVKIFIFYKRCIRAVAIGSLLDDSK